MYGKIVVHGGAGFRRKHIRRGLLGVRNAASLGSSILAEGGSALDAVEAAVSLMEDDPVFNAGKESSLSIAGTVEMDAAIMDGSDLSAGAVALVRTVKNPIRLARLVMENSDHVLLAGETAEKLARAFSLPESNPVTAERRAMLMKIKKGHSDAKIVWVRRNLKLLDEHPEILTYDTVGAVAQDGNGNFAAAASTGGVVMKLPGRIGDTPQIGSGIYADNQAGAATATGLGEIAIKLVLSKTVCLMMEQGLSASNAAALAVTAASKRLKGEAGVIAIDRHGRLTAVHNTPYMPWAFSTTVMQRPRASPRGKTIAVLG
jgi:beta-aspartyl-peptidase (threonine type)